MVLLPVVALFSISLGIYAITIFVKEKYNVLK